MIVLSTCLIMQSQTHLEIIKKEIELIKPDLIITLGGLSYFMLTGKKIKLTDKINKNEYKGTLLMPMVHLSGATRKLTIETFLQSNCIPHCDNNEFGKAYFQIVHNYLNSQL